MDRKFKTMVHEGNVLSLSGNIITSFFGFATFALLARSFQLDVFGEWVIFISSASFIKMFRYGMINSALIRSLSDADENKRAELIGSGGLIGIGTTLLICVILVLCYSAFYESIHGTGFELFFNWYPLLAFINLPMNAALVIMQGDQRFGKDAIIKSIESISFFSVVAVNFFLHQMTMNEIVLALVIVNALDSAICILMGWDGLKYIKKATKRSIKLLLNYSKYSTLTLIGTNLLRSADTFIISFSSLGTAAVALFSIPMKLTEIQQVPLRSFAATAFPKMSKASLGQKNGKVREIFYTYSGAMTLLFIGISIITFVFADLLILILGGDQYLGTDPVTGFKAATILRIFSIYGLLLPIDRMTGIALDAINKPHLNVAKVSIMAIVNVICDIIAIFIFKSLTLVAVGTVIFTTIGVLVGYYYLNKEITLNFSHIFTHGINFFKNMYGKLKD